MTRASRAFFEAGGFGAQLAGVATEVSRALADCPDAGGERHVLNAGCGEGAYLRLLQREQARRAARRTARHTPHAAPRATHRTPHQPLPSAQPSAGAALGYRREQACCAVRRPEASVGRPAMEGQHACRGSMRARWGPLACVVVETRRDETRRASGGHGILLERAASWWWCGRNCSW